MSSPQGLMSSVERLGLEPGALILEVGQGPDCDAQLRAGIESKIGSSLKSGHIDEVVDAVILWWRDTGKLPTETSQRQRLATG